VNAALTLSSVSDLRRNLASPDTLGALGSRCSHDVEFQSAGQYDESGRRWVGRAHGEQAANSLGRQAGPSSKLGLRQPERFATGVNRPDQVVDSTDCRADKRNRRSGP